MGQYSNKLRAAEKLISEYNRQLQETEMPEGVTPREQINSEQFVKKLVLYGGVSDELLKQCTWEDLENCGLPRLLARKIARVFRRNAVEPNWLIKRWKPVLKQWGVPWKEHTKLAEKLEEAVSEFKENASNAAKHQYEDLCEIASDAIGSGSNLIKNLERIRDEHLERAGENLKNLISSGNRPRVHKILTPNPGNDGKIHHFYKIVFTDQEARDKFVNSSQQLPEEWDQYLRWMMEAKNPTYLEGYVQADLDFIQEFENWLVKTTGVNIE